MMTKRFLSLAAAFLLPFAVYAQSSGERKSLRPEVRDRLFISTAVENKIEEVSAKISDPKLRWMFQNCFPNTLDTTVHYSDSTGTPRTFVYTGDIHAMWLRDSGAQVFPYVSLCAQDTELAKLIAGTINCQFSLICKDPYANAFNDGPIGSEWKNDYTGSPISPWVHERKWELDSPCYPIRLAYAYWKATDDTSVFGEDWLNAIELILQTFTEQQRKNGNGPYRFLRKTDRQLDTKAREGFGHPVKPVGLVCSSFRPSDDATQFEFLVPSNFFAADVLRKAAEILLNVNEEAELAERCISLADEISSALKQYAIVEHPVFGQIYAYEVDGFGNCYLMDDANVPSLLSLGYLIPSMSSDPIYRNTRRFVWSSCNPYFCKGFAGEGIGSPHNWTNVIWPMSIIMKAFTAEDDAEIAACLKQLRDTDAGTGFMHECFDCNDSGRYTRPWFAWANTLFGELIVRLADSGKEYLL
ncbi:MAG: glycoside hydrolase family 125 protein [Candidatus Cryptobacteroides sp.]|jgi:meiotically up-regulated gene 157 (Mug157) protein